MTKRAKLTVGEEIVDAIRMADQRYEARVDLATLHEFPGNPKTHDRRLIDQSIDKNGFYGALLCQRSTRRILAGHGRRSSVLGKGQTHVPVLWIDCDDKTARRIVIVDNRGSEAGGWDDRGLANFLRDIAQTDGALDGTGFDAQQLAALALVTRPSDEIRDKQEAAEWVGMPHYAEGAIPPRAIIQFRTLADRDEFCRLLQLPTGTTQVLSAWWPVREKEDRSSLMVDEASNGNGPA